MTRSLKQKTLIARRLRRDGTDVERILWRALRMRLTPWKFRRQHPIGRYIADFACPPHKLVIELDGGQHADRLQADERRSADLAGHGYRVIRFWNNEVLDNLEGVLEAIRGALEAFPTSPGLSAPLGRRGEEFGDPDNTSHRPNTLTVETMVRSERGEDLHQAADAEDLFGQLGI
jgi:very-short-patch-repair endonuclease